jgi:hypothetical protein
MAAWRLFGFLFAFLLIPLPEPAAAPAAPSGLRVGGFPGGQIQLAWTDNADNETSFQVERSVHNRNGYTLLTSLPADSLQYTDTTVSNDTTYWYRLRACNLDGCSAYSKDSFNVSFAAGSVPNLDERYMHFLINEARASPASYGYPAYTPRPPLRLNPLLNYAAHSHSQAILNSDFTIGHCFPDPPSSLPNTEYRCPLERNRDVGYTGGGAENLIAGDDGWAAVESAHQAFLDSAGHRGNLLDANSTEIGLGHTFDPAKGSLWHGQYTQTFAGPAITLPALPGGIVVPYWGRTTTEFAFLVNFYNSGGGAPSQARVVIDGSPHNMTLRRGETANGSYSFTTALPAGAHSYYFEFHYGVGQTARLPETGAFDGPDVEVGAAVLEVPGEYPGLATALARARGEVTVRLAEGQYNETTPIAIPTNGVWIQGAGIDRTIIAGDGSGHVLTSNVDALIQDLTITGGGLGDYFESGLWTTGGHIQLQRVRFTGNNVGLFSWCFTPDCDAQVDLSNVVFDHNQRVALDANEYPLHRLSNVTVAENGRGVILNNNFSHIENSLVVHNTGDGLAAGPNRAPTVRYNDVWGNGLNYSGLSPGTGDLSVDPRFVAESAGDFRLQIGSPAVDAGDPAPVFRDRDGSRNDLGAYGGPQAPPYVLSRVFTPSFSQETSFAVSWQGRAADGVENYDVQYRVGAAGEWQNWLSGVTGTSATFGPTNPVPVTFGEVYCFRSRARDLVGNLEPYPAQPGACTPVVDEIIFLPIVMKR